MLLRLLLVLHHVRTGGGGGRTLDEEVIRPVHDEMCVPARTEVVAVFEKALAVRPLRGPKALNAHNYGQVMFV